jgi:hypothetical protein
MLHRNGGKVIAVTHVGHETHKGVASWFFIGAVEWRDGSISDDAQIAPNCLCYDEGEAGDKEQVHYLLGKLNTYLEDAGEWHDQKEKKDGRVYSWTPKQPEGRVEL